VADSTIQFVPTRLNAAPIVFRGMTGRELGLMAVSGFLLGLPPGLIGFYFIAFAMVPTCMFAGAGLAVWYGGGLMRRLRRGRPETWLYRRLQWEAAVRGINRGQLIVNTAVYRPGRDRRRRSGDRA
jgi:conjugative transfer region protein (TIGR03750 family)